MRPLCRHCQRKPATRALGLCWRCSFNPDVRRLYPSTSKFAPRATGSPCRWCGITACFPRQALCPLCREDYLRHRAALVACGLWDQDGRRIPDRATVQRLLLVRSVVLALGGAATYERVAANLAEEGIGLERERWESCRRALARATELEEAS